MIYVTDLACHLRTLFSTSIEPYADTLYWVNCFPLQCVPLQPIKILRDMQIRAQVVL